MEAPELTAWVMPLLTGASSATGGAVATEVVRLVREKLGSSEDGRAALVRAGEEPDELAHRLTAALSEDPRFADQLNCLFETLRRHAEGPYSAGRDVYSAAISGDRATRNTIAFGPVTIHKTPRTSAALVALALVAVLVLGFAGYGVKQAVDGADAGPRDAGTADANGENVDRNGGGAKGIRAAILSDNGAGVYPSPDPDFDNRVKLETFTKVLVECRDPRGGGFYKIKYSDGTGNMSQGGYIGVDTLLQGPDGGQLRGTAVPLCA
ncbi:hypothetical protein [Streptomyces sp. NPDC003032]